MTWSWQYLTLNPPEQPGNYGHSNVADLRASSPHQTPLDPPVSKSREITPLIIYTYISLYIYFLLSCNTLHQHPLSSSLPSHSSFPHSNFLKTVAGLLVESRERVLFTDGEEAHVCGHSNERVCRPLVGLCHPVTRLGRVLQTENSDSCGQCNTKYNDIVSMKNAVKTASTNLY